jgi:hypothetical protein
MMFHLILEDGLFPFWSFCLRALRVSRFTFLICVIVNTTRVVLENIGSWYVFHIAFYAAPRVLLATKVRIKLLITMKRKLERLERLEI